MPITAREHAEKALQKKQTEVDKAKAKLESLTAKAQDAKAKADAAAAAAAGQAAAVETLEAERDHITQHPALRGSVNQAAKAEDPEVVFTDGNGVEFDPFQ